MKKIGSILLNKVPCIHFFLQENGNSVFSANKIIITIPLYVSSQSLYVKKTFWSYTEFFSLKCNPKLNMIIWIILCTVCHIITICSFRASFDKLHVLRGSASLANEILFLNIHQFVYYLWFPYCLCAITVPLSIAYLDAQSVTFFKICITSFLNFNTCIAILSFLCVHEPIVCHFCKQIITQDGKWHQKYFQKHYKNCENESSCFDTL